MSQRKGNRCVLLSWRDELVGDLLDRVRLAGGDAGRVQAGDDDWSRPVVVGTVQSVATRLDRLRAHGASLLLLDEAHHSTAATPTAIRQALPWRFTLGMTATPFRAAPRGETAGLGDAFEAVVYEHSIQRAIAAGDLVPIEGRRLVLDVDLSNCDLSDEDDVAARFDIDAVNTAVANDYRERHSGTPAVYFCANVAHAHHLAIAMGPRAVAVWGDDPERAKKLAAFDRGDLDVLCNRDLLTEGWDSPRVHVVGLAAPTSSVVRYVQMVGRGTRLHPGKERCVVVDCVGTTESMPYVTWADVSRAEAAAEKRAARAADKEARRRAETAGGRVEGTRSYEVFILGDEAARRIGPAWHYHQRAYSVCARGRGHVRAAVLVERDGPAWVATGTWRDQPPQRIPWVKGEARKMNDGHDRFASLATGTIDACAAAGIDYLRQLGLSPSVTLVEWKDEKATERQLLALRAFGLRRLNDGLSRGEAAMLLDHAITARKVHEWQRDQNVVRSQRAVPPCPLAQRGLPG